MVGTESIEVTKYKERLEAQSRIEEELFTRAPITKSEKKKMKHMKKSRNGYVQFSSCTITFVVSTLRILNHLSCVDCFLLVS